MLVSLQKRFEKREVVSWCGEVGYKDRTKEQMRMKIMMNDQKICLSGPPNLKK